MFWVLHLHNTPWIEATSDLLAFGFNQLVGSNHREWDTGLERDTRADVLHAWNSNVHDKYKD